MHKIYSTRPNCAVIQVSTDECFYQFLKLDQIHVGASTADVYRFKPLMFCANCCQFGHPVDKCEYPDLKICLRCASTEHTVGVCDSLHSNQKTRPVIRCFNCAQLGYPYNHVASAISCSYRLALMATP